MTKIAVLIDFKGSGLEDYGIVVVFNGAKIMGIDRKYNILEVQLTGWEKVIIQLTTLNQGKIQRI